MGLPIKLSAVVKVIGMTSSRGQLTQRSNPALKSYPGIFFNCSFANAEKYSPQRFRLPLSFRIRSEKRILLLNSHSEHHSFSPLMVWGPFRCELSNTRLPVNFNQFWLMSGQLSTYFCSVIRSFSQIPRSGTRNRVVRGADDDVEKNYPFKSLDTHRALRLALIEKSKVTTKTATGKEKCNSQSRSKKNSSLETLNEKVQQRAAPLKMTSTSGSVTPVNVVLPDYFQITHGYKSDFRVNFFYPGQKDRPQLYPPIFKSVLVVESDTKAKLIQGYLGEMFEVLSSNGHVRGLVAQPGSVRPDDEFSMVWEVPAAAWSHLKSIKVALSRAKNLILATDPDREGEAIAWHIVEMLHQQDALPEDVNITRVTFHEITESSVKASLQAPREIDCDLVEAYLARLALDYLIGFNISPLLWRKLPGCKSAGRVQSAALTLICDREKEIDEFDYQEYWTVDAQFQNGFQYSDDNSGITSQLTRFDSYELNKFAISSDLQAKDIAEKVQVSKFFVIRLLPVVSKICPLYPYITSTLQQDAANWLNFSSSRTMSIAQKLYEGVNLLDGNATGLITYIRTDGFHISLEAVSDIRSFIADKYGEEFVSETARRFFNKVINAQEAHEAIRPTDMRILPSKLVRVLDKDSLKLYTLIWCRTMACQMEPAVINKIQCDIGNENKSIVFHSASSRVKFSGFRAVYEDAEASIIRYKGDDYDGYSHDEMYDIFSGLKSGQALNLVKVKVSKHETMPPPRYTEGSLVKKLEELGIGRPSTYAVIINVLKDRNYITVNDKKLHPEFRGRMVSAFLSNYFSEVTNYSFTSHMEAKLDDISAGMTRGIDLLKGYWTRFSKYCKKAEKVTSSQVEEMLEKAFGNVLFSSLRDVDRSCPVCKEGTLVLKIKRYKAGYFIGCNRHPKCEYIAGSLSGEDDEDEDEEEREEEELHNITIQGPKLLGIDPGSNEKTNDVESFTLEDALYACSYHAPYKRNSNAIVSVQGKHPDDGQPVILRLSRVGFSIRHRGTMVSVPKEMKPGEVSLGKALEMLKGG